MSTSPVSITTETAASLKLFVEVARAGSLPESNPVPKDRPRITSASFVPNGGTQFLSFSTPLAASPRPALNAFLQAIQQTPCGPVLVGVNEILRDDSTGEPRTTVQAYLTPVATSMDPAAPSPVMTNLFALDIYERLLAAAARSDAGQRIALSALSNALSDPTSPTVDLSFEANGGGLSRLPQLLAEARLDSTDALPRISTTNSPATIDPMEFGRGRDLQVVLSARPRPPGETIGATRFSKTWSALAPVLATCRAEMISGGRSGVLESLTTEPTSTRISISTTDVALLVGMLDKVEVPAGAVSAPLIVHSLSAQDTGPGVKWTAEVEAREDRTISPDCRRLLVATLRALESHRTALGTTPSISIEWQPATSGAIVSADISIVGYTEPGADRTAVQDALRKALRKIDSASTAYRQSEILAELEAVTRATAASDLHGEALRWLQRRRSHTSDDEVHVHLHAGPPDEKPGAAPARGSRGSRSRR